MNGKLFSRYRRMAKQRGLIFTITVQYLADLFEQQDRCCAVTALPLRIAPGGHEAAGDTTASLDRIDSSMGYEPGNVHWVHWRVNSMKNDMSPAEFVGWCRLVAANYAP